jgi:wyosine [tRNA(Phe)-imidazoG37] synthetase (radical SAM superfamily)
MEYASKIWLEVFIIPGINTSDEEPAGLRKIIKDINPDHIQLNTLDRPVTEELMPPANQTELNRVQTILKSSNSEKVERYPHSIWKTSDAKDPVKQNGHCGSVCHWWTLGGCK